MWTLLDSWFEQDANGNKIIRRQLGKFKERLQVILEDQFGGAFPPQLKTHV